VDLPVKEWGELGQYVAVLIKFMTQKALERRPADDLRPVFIWADEAHYFATAYDQIFQTTARASRACTVYLTQSYSNYRGPLDIVRIATPPRPLRTPEQEASFESRWKNVLRSSDSKKNH
jgi:hypothetical protein